MTNWIDLVNFAVAVGGLIVVLMGFILALTTPYMERWSRRFFLIFFVLLIAYVSSDLVSQISLVLLGTGFSMLSRIAIFSESLFSSMLIPLLTLYLLHCTGEDWKKNPVIYTAGGFWLIYFGLLVVTQFTTFIYYVTEDNIYRRGTWYPVLLIPTVLLMLLNLSAMVRRRSQLSGKQRVAFSVYLLLPLVCMIIQMFSYGLLLIVIGTSVASVFLFVFILSDQTEQYVRTHEELALQRASVSVLQMRPHFIYNTMSSIYYLCSQDPEKAQQVILDFNTYLRKNFTAIAKGGTIPFTEELEHTRAYLDVEQVRFEGNLFVEFDTPHTNFRLPPLTLQPIVENSVKYGCDPELEPLYISVYTRETEHGIEIVVEDSGPGFEKWRMTAMPDTSPSQQNSHTAANEPHIALGNIRGRLETMCRGSLTIEPRETGGTKVVIRVPEQRHTGTTPT
ncbi:MAG: histidine kinase [Lachnospiraceae bacterium]|nr:histidine kinase [Lachnospiraceae bacterium]